MKYKIIIKNSINSDGLGLPCVSIYFAGCDRDTFCGSFCYGCQNPELQDMNVNIPAYTSEEIFRYVSNFILDWREISKEVAVAFIGGEPLTNYNKQCLLDVSKRLKKTYNFITTIVYTWREVEDIKKYNLDRYLYYIDKCVCGSYEDTLKNKDYILGSTNQCIYNVKEDKIMLKYEESIV